MARTSFGHQPRAIRWRGGKPKTWTVNGWTGMYDSRSKAAERDGEVPLLINLMPTDPVRRGPLYLRSGRQPLAAGETAPQLGSGSHVVQWYGAATLSNGSTGLYAIVDGEIWSVNASSGAVTKVVSTANFATASITPPNVNAPCRCVVFNDTLVVTSELNQPFTWDGSSGAGGLTDLTDAPFGPDAVTVYYAKLFFVKDGGRTIVWSEEYQPNTGYEAGGYNNAWDLVQTSQERIRDILGTNEALYYIRSDSVGSIRGAVSTTFQTDGVHDSIFVGAGVGGNPAPLAYCGNSLFWAFGDTGHVYAYRPGSGVTKLTEQLPRLYGTGRYLGHASNISGSPVYGVGEDDLANVNIRLLVPDLFNQRLYVELAADDAGRWVAVFDAASYRLLGLWSFGTANPPRISSSSTLKLQYAAVSLVSDTVQYIYCDELGYVFTQRLSFSSASPTADYDEAGTGTAVVGTLVGPMHGHSSNLEWQFSQLDVLIDQLDTSTTGIGYLTSRHHKVSLAPSAQSVSASGVSNDPYERRLAVGLNANGRWLRPIIKLTGSTSTDSVRQPPQLFGYTLTGYPVSRSPSVT